MSTNPQNPQAPKPVSATPKPAAQSKPAAASKPQSTHPWPPVPTAATTPKK